MDEDITIINSETRNEKFKKFFQENRKKIIFFFIFVIIVIITFYSYQIYRDGQIKRISNLYNTIVIEYQNSEKSKTISSLKELIGEKNSTYSPLALYFIIDNNLIEDKKEVNKLFDILINKTDLEAEIQNLIIYKKALFNADETDELTLLNILNPIINSESIWKSHALYLAGEFFYNKKEIQKSKDFFQQIILIENPNSEIKVKAQKRLNRDLGD